MKQNIILYERMHIMRCITRRSTDKTRKKNIGRTNTSYRRRGNKRENRGTKPAGTFANDRRRVRSGPSFRVHRSQ